MKWLIQIYFLSDPFDRRGAAGARGLRGHCQEGEPTWFCSSVSSCFPTDSVKKFRYLSLTHF